MRQVDGLGGEGWYLHRDRPTDRVDLHHLRERKRDETEERREEVTGDQGGGAGGAGDELRKGEMRDKVKNQKTASSLSRVWMQTQSSGKATANFSNLEPFHNLIKLLTVTG